MDQIPTVAASCQLITEGTQVVVPALGEENNKIQYTEIKTQLAEINETRWRTQSKTSFEFNKTISGKIKKTSSNKASISSYSVSSYGASSIDVVISSSAFTSIKADAPARPRMQQACSCVLETRIASFVGREQMGLAVEAPSFKCHHSVRNQIPSLGAQTKGLQVPSISK